LVELLDGQRPVEVRIAALTVLGELAERSARLDDVLCRLVDDLEPEVRLHALRAVGRLHVEKALPQLIARVRDGGAESEAAAQAAARLGAKGTRALQELMPDVAPGLRRRIAGALPAGDTTKAGSAAIAVLLDADENVVDAAARSLLAKTPELDKGQKRRFADHILAILNARSASVVNSFSEAALLRVLSALDEPRAERIFWERLEGRRATEVRLAALQGIGRSAGPINSERLRALISLSCDQDFRVVAPSLMILKDVPARKSQLNDWLKLFSAPDVAARRLGLDKVGNFDTPQVSAAILQQLDHPDRTWRDQAVQSLAALDKGRRALVRELVTANSVERAWALARIQAPLLANYEAGLRRTLFARACELVEKDDRRADALLFLLRESDPRGLRDQLEKCGLAFRKKKNYDKAARFFRLLSRDPACGDMIRLELAGCGLKASAKDLAAETRSSDPCLEQFAAIIHRNAIDVAAAVSKASWLGADELFYLGFHFVERSGPEKDFGTSVLRQVTKRFPHAKVAKLAKNKLRSQGVR
jgi:HEAT repeat protein